jgi:uncharacterized RDD family membrane protein YckC
MMLLRSDRRALHDILAGTRIVVRDRRSRRLAKESADGE